MCNAVDLLLQVILCVFFTILCFEGEQEKGRGRGVTRAVDENRAKTFFSAFRRGKFFAIIGQSKCDRMRSRLGAFLHGTVHG